MVCFVGPKQTGNVVTEDESISHTFTQNNYISHFSEWSFFLKNNKIYKNILMLMMYNKYQFKLIVGYIWQNWLWTLKVTHLC